ncbi:hypothetical protein GQ457_12G020740 [Hibiscus cannabinus]
MVDGETLSSLIHSSKSREDRTEESEMVKLFKVKPIENKRRREIGRKGNVREREKEMERKREMEWLLAA